MACMSLPNPNALATALHGASIGACATTTGVATNAQACGTGQGYASWLAPRYAASSWSSLASWCIARPCDGAPHVSISLERRLCMRSSECRLHADESFRSFRSKLTRTSRGLRTVRTGYAYQPPACCTYQRRRAACPGGRHDCTYAVHVRPGASCVLCTYELCVPASCVLYVPEAQGS